MRVLLDNCVAKKFGRRFTDHEVLHASTLGWSELENGRLMAAAKEDGFDVMITTDRSIQHQQGLFPVPVIIIDSLLNADNELVRYLPAVLTILSQQLQPRVYVIDRLPNQPRRN